MRVEAANLNAPKGWLAGPWNATLPIAVGYATEAIDDPHVHARLTEVFLIARGRARARVEYEDVDLSAGDALFVEPGERHTFLESLPDFLLFVVHPPGLSGQAARSERSSIPRAALGL
jgi:mannose-6-phosphate isomerase-like protein (cupin superfamily)